MQKGIYNSALNSELKFEMKDYNEVLQYQCQKYLARVFIRSVIFNFLQSKSTKNMHF